MNQPPVCDRAGLVDAIARFVAHKGGVDPQMVRGPVERAIAELGEDSVTHLRTRLAHSSGVPTAN